MTVYVDNMLTNATVGRTTSRWSHLFADTPEELAAFAKKLRLKSAWLQYPGTFKEHYDVTDKVRTKALQLGAVNLPVLTPAWEVHMNQKRQAFGLPLIGAKRLELDMTVEPEPEHYSRLF